MARKNPKERRTRKSKLADGFRISNGPVVGPAPEAEKGVDDFDHVIELSRIHGAPMLFAIARDPHTIFSYWSVDWSTVFAKEVPVDKQVHLRVFTADGEHETSAAVEPMAGNSYVAVSQPRGVYRVEIGYYYPEDIWNSVASSNEVTMPTDKPAEDSDVDFATIPLHLSFQQLLNLFRLSNGAPLAETISRFQERALTDKGRQLLSAEERQILNAMDVSLSEIAAARRAFIDTAGSETLRKRTETFLGFGSSSPTAGFGASSWS